MSNSIHYIGLTGVATSGKDLFCKYAQAFFHHNSLATQEVFPLAARIRSDLQSLIQEHFYIDVWKPTPSEKELIRPIMVAYSNAKRQRSDGKYFWKCNACAIGERVHGGLTQHPDRTYIVWVTDVRFAKYPEDEHHWLKEICGGNLIHITRIGEDGIAIEPANEFERDNDNKLYQMADYRFKWNTTTPEIAAATVNQFFEAHPELWQL